MSNNMCNFTLIILLLYFVVILQDNQGIGDLNIAGNIISDDKQKAEALGNQFKSVFTHEGNSKLPNLNDSPHGKYPN